MNAYEMEQRIRDLEAELAGARAKIKELENIVGALGGEPEGYEPAKNAMTEGADA